MFKLDFLEFVELLNSILLVLILLLLILNFLFNFRFEKLLLILDIFFVFFLVTELSMKFFIQDNIKFFKENWLEILSLVPLVILARFFYMLGFIRSEHSAESIHYAIHAIEKLSKEDKLLKIFNILKIIENRPAVVRIVYRILLNLKKLKFRKAAFSLDLETLIKFILLVLFLVVITIILIKLKDSNILFYLENF
jgi:hypothetical protein